MSDMALFDHPAHRLTLSDYSEASLKLKLIQWNCSCRATGRGTSIAQARALHERHARNDVDWEFLRVVVGATKDRNEALAAIGRLRGDK